MMSEIHIYFEGDLMADIHTFEPLWGEWYIVKRLGQGSFGTVYLAEKSELGKKYYSAIKHIKLPVDDHASDELYSETDETRQKYYDDMLHTLMQEIEINYRLKGLTNIVSYEEHKVYPRESEPGYDVFIKMELLTSLTDHIKSTPITVGDVVRLGKDICTALTVLQQDRIVHRDIKPANIFIHSGGYFKLGDFGVARTMEKTLSSMSVKGTIAYMPPEIRQGGDGDYRVDVYSLGLVLYRLLNGNRAPFLPLPPASITYNADMQAHKRRLQGEDLPPPAMADERLSAIILRACAYRSEDRYLDAAHFRDDLMEYETTVSQDLLELVVLGKTIEAPEIKVPVSESSPQPDATELLMPLEAKIPVEAEIPVPETDEQSSAAIDSLEETVLLTHTAQDSADAAREVQDSPHRSDAADGFPEFKSEPEPIYEPIPEAKSESKSASRSLSPKMKRGIMIGGAAAITLVLAIVLLPKKSDPADAPSPTLSLMPSPVVSSTPSPVMEQPSPTVTPLEERGIVLTDEGLDAYIRESLGLTPEEEITSELLEQIDTLLIGTDTGFAVRTLEDLSLLSNLKVLDISGQQPESFDPITKLDRLTELNLGGCDFDHDEFLEHLPAGIQNLTLNNTGLYSLQFASRLEHLEYLDISENKVDDLTPLAELKQLSELVASNNPISDWSAVESVQTVSGKPADPPSPSSAPIRTPTPAPAYTDNSSPSVPSGPSLPLLPTQAPVPTPTQAPVPTPTPSQGSILVDPDGWVTIY